MNDSDADLLTDEQFLLATGISSVPSLKKMLVTKFILPIHVAIPGGGRERRWKPEQVLMAQIAVRLSAGIGCSLQTAAELVIGLDAGWCARAANGDPQHGTRLAVGDRSVVWLEVDRGRFRKLHAGTQPEPLIQLDSLTERHIGTFVLRVTAQAKS